MACGESRPSGRPWRRLRRLLQALGQFLAEGDRNADIEASAGEGEADLLARLLGDRNAQAAGDALAFLEDQFGMAGDRADRLALSAIAGGFGTVFDGVAAQGEISVEPQPQSRQRSASEWASVSVKLAPWPDAGAVRGKLAGIAHPGLHLGFGESTKRTAKRRDAAWAFPAR